MRYLSFAVCLLFAGAVLAQDAMELVKQLKSPDVEERRRAAKKLSDLKEEAKPATTDILNALKQKDQDMYVKRFLAQALGAVKADPKAAVPVLASLLGDSKVELVSAAIESLGQMGAQGVDPLVRVLNGRNSGTTKGKEKEKKGGTVNKNDPEAELRAKAANALGDIGTAAKPAVPALIKALNDKTARIEAANALGSIGPGAKDAVAKLKEEAEDKQNKRDKNFTKAVNEAIRKIDGNASTTVKKKKKDKN